MSDKKRAVLALGFFDSVHKGHVQVISTAKNLSKTLNANLIVLTFNGDIKKAVKIDYEGYVFKKSERLERLTEIGCKDVYFMPLQKKFLSKTPEEFLSYLDKKFNVLGYVCGEDYTFGYKGKGNTETLKTYAKSTGKVIKTVPLEKSNGEKISTSLIKTLLKKGEIEKANLLLSKNYEIEGKVVKGRQVGGKLNFKTANLKIEKDRFKLKPSVYYGKVCYNGKTYKSIINYGSRPTFNLKGDLIEVHLIDFNGNLYGEKIKIEFIGYLREIVKFNSEEKLKEQLEKDRIRVIK